VGSRSCSSQTTSISTEPSRLAGHGGAHRSPETRPGAPDDTCTRASVAPGRRRSTASFEGHVTLRRDATAGIALVYLCARHPAVHRHLAPPQPRRAPAARLRYTVWERFPPFPLLLAIRPPIMSRVECRAPARSNALQFIPHRPPGMASACSGHLRQNGTEFDLASIVRDPPLRRILVRSLAASLLRCHLM
jgi:hypothetical protein